MTAKKVFVAYSRDDRMSLLALKKHLASLEREELISVWVDREIIPGDAWEDDIESNLESADLFICLVSASFIASDYCWKKELNRALERRTAGELVILPVIVKPVDWSGAKLAGIQALPRDGRPVSRWPDKDEAWTDVARGVRRALTQKSHDSKSTDVAVGDGIDLSTAINDSLPVAPALSEDAGRVDEFSEELKATLARLAQATESAAEVQREAAERARFAATARVKLTTINLGRKAGHPHAFAGVENEGPSEARNLEFFVFANDERISTSPAGIRVFPSDRFHNRDSFNFSPRRNKDGSAVDGLVYTIHADWEDGLGERRHTPRRCFRFESHPNDPTNNWHSIEGDCSES